MESNRSSTSLVTGLAAFGLALAVAAMGLYRRKRAGGAAGSPQEDTQAAAGAGDEAQVPREDPPDGREAPNQPPSGAPPEDRPLKPFFLLTFVLSIPIWVVGRNPLPLPIKLPVSALIFISPVIAAAILTYRRAGSQGVRQLLKRAFDAQKIKRKAWYAPALVLLPAIFFGSFVVMRLAGLPLPDRVEIPLLLAPVFFILFWITATCEELGWTGYALDPLQNRWGAFTAALILGIVWGLFHLLGDVQNGQPANWILWQRLYSVALRVLIVWIYNNTGKSVFAAILVHTMDNVCVFLFPNYGSHYNPFITGTLTWLAAVLVTFLWGPKSLARYRGARAVSRV